ncbi:MAG: hypothetical protein E7388_04210 [Ruminococcaceae bacterium]|nr:hypothetical protein [Oscillospiraceae bacterium]
MKKYLSILLVISMLFLASGCGNTLTKPTEKPNHPTLPPSVYPETLTTFTSNEIDSEALFGTKWELTGGMINGTEMTQTEFDEALAKFNGKLQLEFINEFKIQSITGEYSYSTLYSLVKDNTALNIFLIGEEYFAVITVVDDSEVLVMASTTEPETVLYFTPVK